MSIYFGFVDSANQHSRNLASIAWVVYFPNDELVSSGGGCLGPKTNNVIEYHVVIGILTKASSLGISHMIVHLNSQLMVSQLNRIYAIYNPILLCIYLCICILEIYFDYIHYEHIPRELNSVTNSLANYVFYWHLAHI